MTFKSKTPKIIFIETKITQNIKVKEKWNIHTLNIHKIIKKIMIKTNIIYKDNRLQIIWKNLIVI